MVACPEVTPERILTQLKAWSTRALRQGGCLSQNTRAWTHHGSTRYLWKEHSVNDAIAYVLEYQGPDLP